MSIFDKPTNINFFKPTSFRFICTALPESEFYCQGVTLPGVSINEIPVATPLNPHYKSGDRVLYDEFVIQIIIDEDMKNFIEIHDWIVGLGKPQTTEQFAKREKLGLDTTGVLTILSNASNVNIEYHFNGLWPKAITTLDLAITDPDPATVIASVSFQYNYYEIKQIKQS